MPLTTALLGGGVTVNEIHGNPAGPGQDYNGNGLADGSDSYVELLNTSGTPVDISGWEIHVFGAVTHTFDPGTILGAGDHITVVNSNAGTAFPITGVAGTAVYSDSPQAFGDPVNLVLYDPGANQYIMIGGASAASWVAFDTNALIAIHPGASQVGAYETVPTQTAGVAHTRATDGDDTWASANPTPGAVNCFLPGTLIATPAGELPVERLGPGDLVLTAAGKTIPVRFLLRQTVDARAPGTARHAPVCISAGALGNGLPHSDLTVTADHGLVIDGLVINASALVNGSTISFLPLAEIADRITLYHIETDCHEAILANGAPTESFIDAATRSDFDNYADYIALYGAERLIAEMPAARSTSRRMLPDRIRQRLDHAAHTSQPRIRSA